ncbi:hypothetical protein [Hymenobacter negativus]|uniref:Phage portal protein n=1 Tax=Hymenobacter negativus TaxID=2795026 RepID=A0ABS3QHX1_9BACT|nr:hypothetical protein [Hymenobacter negativus]MBO2010846.1 hypothetical protein [Hymenobacter negativus]
MPPRPRSTPSTLVRTGYKAEDVAPALPDGKTPDAIKIEPWGANNLQPQDVLRVLYDSGTAETCTERLTQFINGRGFANPATARTMANPEQTMNQLLAEASGYAAAGFGVAYIARYTFGGTDPEVYVAPVDCLRKEKEGGLGRYVINHKLAVGKMPAGENRVYLPYDPLATAEEISDEVIEAAASEAGYWGHLHWPFGRKVGRNLYPVPTWWSAKESVESDAELPKYELKQLRNGFFPDAVFTLVGKKYAPIEDSNWTPAEGQTEKDRPFIPSPDLTNVIQTITALKGASTQSSVFVNVVETEDEKPQLDFIDKGPNSKGLTDMTTRIEGRVYRRLGVPPVLCGVAEPGLLGSNQQIVNSIKLFGLTVNPRRAHCTEPLQQFFPLLDFTVLPLNPVEYIDPAVATKMTDDELRAIQDLPPLEKPKDSEAERTIKALNGLSPLVATKVLEEMTSEEIRGLISLGPKTKPVPKPRAK